MFDFLKKPALPQPTRCHACGTLAAEAVCHNCATERPAYTALKNLSRRERDGAVQPLKNPAHCRYRPSAICGCGDRGDCLEVA